MLESNIRTLYPGSTIYVPIRKARLGRNDIKPELLEKACAKLKSQRGLAAVPALDCQELWVLSSYAFEPITLKDDSGDLIIKDSGGSADRIRLSDANAKQLLPRLIERALLITLGKRSLWWVIKGQPRHWYESQSFKKADGIEAYRRFSVSGEFVEDEGIGIVVDVTTAFYSINTLAYYFDEAQPNDEARQRRDRFEQLTARQQGQKGTLLYSTNINSTCYFDDAPPGITCSQTGSFTIDGHTYSSVADYYDRKDGAPEVSATDRAVLVNFKGLGSSARWVAAKLLRVRIMNEQLPQVLKEVAQISPLEREQLISRFWACVGKKPFGPSMPGLKKTLLRPSGENSVVFPVPDLEFGSDTCLEAPDQTSPQAYRKNYNRRIPYLNKYGCYAISATMPRDLYVAFPNTVDTASVRQFTEDMGRLLEDWTDTAVSLHHLPPYADLDGALRSIRQIEEQSIVLFVLKSRSNSYYEVAYQLGNLGWRIKRLTQNVLSKKYQQFQNGAWDKKLNRMSLDRGKRNWNSFVERNALAVLQLLNAVPYRSIPNQVHEAQITIDVSYEQRYFAVSVLINRLSNAHPSFDINTRSIPKLDLHSSAINPHLLGQEILKSFDELQRPNFTPLNSLLFVRDGHFYGKDVEGVFVHEVEGITTAIAQLRQRGFLTKSATIDFVNLLKDTSSGIRVWELRNDKRINPLDGTLIRINARKVVLATTGTTLNRHGTAQPIVLQAFKGQEPDLIKVARTVFSNSQMNWSSPNVSQRLPVDLKRTDEVLKDKSAQEVKRFSRT